MNAWNCQFYSGSQMEINALGWSTSVNFPCLGLINICSIANQMQITLILCLGVKMANEYICLHAPVILRKHKTMKVNHSMKRILTMLTRQKSLQSIEASYGKQLAELPLLSMNRISLFPNLHCTLFSLEADNSEMGQLLWELSARMATVLFHSTPRFMETLQSPYNWSSKLHQQGTYCCAITTWLKFLITQLCVMSENTNYGSLPVGIILTGIKVKLEILLHPSSLQCSSSGYLWLSQSLNTQDVILVLP